MHNTLQLRKLRLLKGLTQQQLAHLLEVSVHAISSLENGLLIKIASFFNVSIDRLIGHPNITRYSVDQIKLLEFYNSLDDIHKGALLERALILVEESNGMIKKTKLI